MSDFEDMFGEWGRHADGTPTVVVAQPQIGSAAKGPALGPAQTFHGLPVFRGNRLIRNSTGDEVVASVMIYADGDRQAAFTVGGMVAADDPRPTRVIRVDRQSVEGLFDFSAVWCE